MGHDNGHSLRISPELRVRRRKGKPVVFTPCLENAAETIWQSNYFKGSILVLTYLVIVVGFYVAGFSSNMDIIGVDPFDTLALGKQSIKTTGRSMNGRAF